MKHKPKYTGKFYICIEKTSTNDVGDILEYIDTKFYGINKDMEGIVLYNHNKNNEYVIGTQRLKLFFESIQERRKRIIEEV